MLRLIARRGGFLARKSDGERGAETIWKGLTHVRVAAETLRLLRDEGGDGSYVQRGAFTPPARITSAGGISTAC
jgi:hypothetical protein